MAGAAAVIAAVIAVASAAAYLFIGWRWVAPVFVRRTVQHHIDRYPSLDSDRELANQRRDAEGDAWMVVFLWPLYLAGVLMATRLAIRAPLTELEARWLAEKRAARIAELERELNIRGQR